MKQIKKIGVGQTAKLFGVFYLISGATMFVPIGLIRLVVGQPQGGPPGWVFVLAPGLYGIAGYVFVVLSCLLYNFLAGRIGGIQIEFDSE